MANQNGSGVIEIFSFLCLFSVALLYGYKVMQPKVEVSEEKQENVRLRELLKDYKDRFDKLDSEVQRAHVRIDNDQTKMKNVASNIAKDIDYHKQLLSGLEVDLGKIGTKVSSISKGLESAHVKIPKVVAVQLKAMEKPLEVRITNNLQKTYSKSVERWKRRNYGWEKEIVTKTIPYKSKKKKLAPDQEQKLKSDVEETRTAMTEAGL